MMTLRVSSETAVHEVAEAPFKYTPPLVFAQVKYWFVPLMIAE